MLVMPSRRLGSLTKRLLLFLMFKGTRDRQTSITRAGLMTQDAKTMLKYGWITLYLHNTLLGVERSECLRSEVPLAHCDCKWLYCIRCLSYVWSFFCAGSCAALCGSVWAPCVVSSVRPASRASESSTRLFGPTPAMTYRKTFSSIYTGHNRNPHPSPQATTHFIYDT